MNNVRIYEPLGKSDHNQLHFEINVKSESKNKKRIGETSTKCLELSLETSTKIFPLKNRGKRSRKKHLSNEAITKNTV